MNGKKKIYIVFFFRLNYRVVQVEVVKMDYREIKVCMNQLFEAKDKTIYYFSR